MTEREHRVRDAIRDSINRGIVWDYFDVADLVFLVERFDRVEARCRELESAHSPAAPQEGTTPPEIDVAGIELYRATLTLGAKNRGTAFTPEQSRDLITLLDRLASSALTSSQTDSSLRAAEPTEDDWYRAAGGLSHDLTRMAEARDAWREFARHVAGCVECWETSYTRCAEGKELHEAARAADAVLDRPLSRPRAPLASTPPEPHPEDTCERCGRENVVWFAPSDIWNKAAPDAGILCPVCFVKAAEAAGIVPPAWKLAPERRASRTANTEPTREQMRELLDHLAALEATAAQNEPDDEMRRARLEDAAMLDWFLANFDRFWFREDEPPVESSSPTVTPPQTWPDLWCEACREYVPVTDDATKSECGVGEAPYDLCCTRCAAILATYQPSNPEAASPPVTEQAPNEPSFGVVYDAMIAVQNAILDSATGRYSLDAKGLAWLKTVSRKLSVEHERLYRLRAARSTPTEEKTDAE